MPLFCVNCTCRWCARLKPALALPATGEFCWPKIQSEGLTGWGECTAGERPVFSGESTDTAWQVLVRELGPMLAAEFPEHGGDCPRIFRQVRGNRMAKAALENAIWDLEAQREGISLSRLIGGVRDSIPCGVSLGIQSSIPGIAFDH